ILDHSAAGRGIVVPAQQVGCTVHARYVRCVERVVPVVDRCQAMSCIATGFGDHVYYSAGSMAELRLITRWDYLELRNGVLIELCRCAAIELVRIRKAVDEKPGVIRSFPQDRCRCIGALVRVPINGDARNEL